MVKLKDHKFKDGKEKGHLSFKGLKAQKKKKPPDTTGRKAGQNMEDFLTCSALFNEQQQW